MRAAHGRPTPSQGRGYHTRIQATSSALLEYATSWAQRVVVWPAGEPQPDYETHCSCPAIILIRSTGAPSCEAHLRLQCRNISPKFECHDTLYYRLHKTPLRSGLWGVTIGDAVHEQSFLVAQFERPTGEGRGGRFSHCYIQF